MEVRGIKAVVINDTITVYADETDKKIWRLVLRINLKDRKCVQYEWFYDKENKSEQFETAFDDKFGVVRRRRCLEAPQTNPTIWQHVKNLWRQKHD